MQAKFSLSDWNLSQRGQVIACSTKLRCRSTELSLRCAPASFWRIAFLPLAVLRPWFAVGSWQCFQIIFGKIQTIERRKRHKWHLEKFFRNWDTFASGIISSSCKSEYLNLYGTSWAERSSTTTCPKDQILPLQPRPLCLQDALKREVSWLPCLPALPH